MAIGQDFYPDAGMDEISNLSRHQSAQALGYGDQAARYADPFMGERAGYQNQLRNLMANPGSFASSPYYQFAYDQGLNALQRKGGVRSGNKLAALVRYGQGMAGQEYFKQANLLSNLAMGGSSPAAAGLAYARGTERSQDYNQLSAAARTAGKQGGASVAPSTPWWMQPQQMQTGGSQSPGWTQTTYGAGGSLPYSYPGGGYTPSYGAGTGYMTSDSGTTTFGGYDPMTDPYWSDAGNTYDAYSDGGSYAVDESYYGG